MGRRYIYDHLGDLVAEMYKGMWFIEPNAAWDLVKAVRQNGVRKLPK